MKPSAKRQIYSYVELTGNYVEITRRLDAVATKKKGSQGGGEGGGMGWGGAGCNRLVTSIGELALGPLPCQLSPGGDAFGARDLGWVRVILSLPPPPPPPQSSCSFCLLNCLLLVRSPDFFSNIFRQGLG